MSAKSVGRYVWTVIEDSRTRNDIPSKVTISVATMAASAKLFFVQMPKLTSAEFMDTWFQHSVGTGIAVYYLDPLFEWMFPNLNPTTRHLEAAVTILVLQGLIGDSFSDASPGSVLASAAWRLFLAQSVPLSWEGLCLMKRKISQFFT